MSTECIDNKITSLLFTEGQFLFFLPEESFLVNKKNKIKMYLFLLVIYHWKGDRFFVGHPFTDILLSSNKMLYIHIKKGYILSMVFEMEYRWKKLFKSDEWVWIGIICTKTILICEL